MPRLLHLHIVRIGRGRLQIHAPTVFLGRIVVGRVNGFDAATDVARIEGVEKFADLLNIGFRESMVISPDLIAIGLPVDCRLIVPPSYDQLRRPVRRCPLRCLADLPHPWLAIVNARRPYVCPDGQAIRLQLGKDSLTIGEGSATISATSCSLELKILDSDTA